jgi:hypothetical protein
MSQPSATDHAARPPFLTVAVMSLPVGIAGVLLLWVPYLGWLLGIVAVALGHIAMNYFQRAVRPRSGKGLAVGGLATGYFAAIVGTFFFIATLLVAVSDTAT